MLNHRRTGKERTDDGAPFRKSRRLTETHGVVFQRVPEDLQYVALLVFDAAVDLVALKSAGLMDDGFQAVLDGLFKSGVLTGVDAAMPLFFKYSSAFLAI